jgi:hypothetical protein
MPVHFSGLFGDLLYDARRRSQIRYILASDIHRTADRLDVPLHNFSPRNKDLLRRCPYYLLRFAGTSIREPIDLTEQPDV